MTSQAMVSRSDAGLFREFWHYRELFFFFVWRDLKVRYKQTALGFAWAVIQPLFAMLVFTLFFGRMRLVPEGVSPQVFYFSALLPWTFFSSALNRSGNSLITNTNLITKVYFPRTIIPSASVLSGVFDFAIASAVLLVLLLWYGVPLSTELLLLPVLLVPLILLSLGIGMLFSAMNVSFRDVKHMIPFLIQMWMFVSPVIYPSSMIPGKLKFVAAVNPMVGIIDNFRSAVLPEETVQWNTFAQSMLVNVVILLVGLWYFRKHERDFADYI